MNPSLALIPSAYSAGKLYSVLPEDGTGDFDVSRNGTATYVGSDGLLKTAQANEPRLEFNPDGSFKGVLVEPAATNLIRRSENFNDSIWIKTAGVILTQNYGIAPNGLQQSTRVQLNSATLQSVYTTGNFPENKTASIFVKGISGEFIRFGTGINIGFGLGQIFTFNGDWQKLTFTRNVIETIFGVSYIPNILGSSSDFEIWGAQLETGSVATSYIPTVASTVTRPADIMTVQEPTGISEIKETVNGIEQAVSPTGGIYQLPNGHISRILMI